MGQLNASRQHFILRSPATRSHAAQVVSEMIVDDKKPYEVIIRPWEQKRTDLQNKYLWGWLYKNIADQLEAAGIVIALDDGREYPYDKDMLHEIFSDRYLTHDIIAFKGKERRIKYSTTQLLKSPKEGQEQRCFATYVTAITQFAYQYWGIHIPPTYNDDYAELEAEMNSRGSSMLYPESDRWGND